MSVDNLIKKEYDTYYAQAVFKSENTKKLYKSHHKRITDYIQMPIYQAKPDELIDAIYELAENPNTRNGLLNTAIVFYKVVGKDSGKKFVKAKEKINLDIKAHKQEIDIEKGETLPTIHEVETYIKSLFAEEEWRAYIINWLLFHYNLRNLDLDLEIVKTLHQTKIDKSRNYLVVRRHDMILVRNKYKTFHKFGHKRHSFRNICIRRAVKFLLATQPPNQPVYLLSTEKGERIEEGSIAKYIRARTLNGISEGDINKIQVSSITSMSDYTALLRMSDRRGTSVETLLSEYHIPIQKLFGKTKKQTFPEVSQSQH